MTGPATTEKPSTSETAVDNSANISAQQAGGLNPLPQQTEAESGQKQKGQAELAAEKEYEARMEDEYAKREGGA